LAALIAATELRSETVGCRWNALIPILGKYLKKRILTAKFEFKEKIIRLIRQFLCWYIIATLFKPATGKRMKSACICATAPLADIRFT
jgi:hypothetical protein